MIYTANHYTGRVEAFRIQAPHQSGEPAAVVSPLESMWEIRLDAGGSVTLTPLPNGGVVASFRQKMFGISASGRLLWTYDSPAQVLDWVLLGDRLIFSTTGEDASVWEADETGLSAWAMPKSGQLVVVDDQLVVYSEDGVYRPSGDRLSADLLYTLPKRRLEQGDLVALADGGWLLIHADSFDKRLIALNGDGMLRWQRSVVRHFRGNEHHLLVVDGRPLIVSHRRAAADSELSVFGIDMDRGALVRLFAARGWTPRPGDIWAYAIGDDRSAEHRKRHRER